MRTAVYNVHKVSEGGMGQKEAYRIAASAGAQSVRPSTSVYVGQTAIVVTASDRVHKRISKLLYN